MSWDYLTDEALLVEDDPVARAHLLRGEHLPLARRARELVALLRHDRRRLHRGLGERVALVKDVV